MADKPAKTKSGKGKWIIIMVVVLLVLGGGGAGAWWFLMRPKPQVTAQELAAQREKLAHFVSLDPFVTNVLSTDGNTHYLQVKIDLKTFEPKTDDEVKAMTPEIRNAILRILAAQQADKVGTVQVREQLRSEILTAINQILNTGSDASGKAVAPTAHAAQAAGPVVGVYFTAFVVQ
ncbi:MAG: flagellar basal body-associated FliL family protein [Proteobacteria bacterium]|nr:flagellar basal body-associated FliL family protein [Pseudomonadota bacterium]